MKNNLASNIRSLRKEKGLTQEQLAEVFRVTIGAVHKWEAGLSVPDISLLMEMADFFDVSLDVLVGFTVRDNRNGALAERLRKMTDTQDPHGPEEAEKALKKYPNSFRIVYECAYLFRAFGLMFKINKEYCLRAIELYEKAISLISQSSDPNIDATTLYGDLATIYMAMGDYDKSLEIYKAHNGGYIFNARIGHLLVSKKEYKEAESFLSYALVNQIGNMVNLISSKALCYAGKGDFEKAKEILDAGIKFNALFKKKGVLCFLDRIDCLYLTGISYAELMLKNKDGAKDHLKNAKKKAEEFDAAPDFDARRERFVEIDEPCLAFDTTGETCIEGIESTIKLLESKELLKLWKSINT